MDPASNGQSSSCCSQCSREALTILSACSMLSFFLACLSVDIHFSVSELISCMGFERRWKCPIARYGQYQRRSDELELSLVRISPEQRLGVPSREGLSKTWRSSMKPQMCEAQRAPKGALFFPISCAQRLLNFRTTSAGSKPMIRPSSISSTTSIRR